MEKIKKLFIPIEKIDFKIIDEIYCIAFDNGFHGAESVAPTFSQKKRISQMKDFLGKDRYILLSFFEETAGVVTRRHFLSYRFKKNTFESDEKETWDMDEIKNWIIENKGKNIVE